MYGASIAARPYLHGPRVVIHREYIYRYTSQVLHPMPASFHTSSKNLELAEMRVLLYYIYVRLLDVIDVVSEFIDRADRLAGPPNPSAE